MGRLEASHSLSLLFDCAKGFMQQRIKKSKKEIRINEIKEKSLTQMIRRTFANKYYTNQGAKKSTKKIFL